FERVAREGCRTFMLGYQSTDGVPITVNDWLLSDVLRGEWGYTGTLITDWDNVGRMVWEQKVQPDYAHAAAAAVTAGNDMVMTTPHFYEGALEAVERGMLSPDAFDTAVTRILTLKFDLGLFENPRLPSEQLPAIVGSPAHAELNLDIARRSLVLLRNEGELLPLAGGFAADRTGRASGGDPAPRRIAVLGPLADDAQTQLGDWAGGSGQADWIDGQPREMITTVLDGIRRHAPENWSVTHARGADILTLAPDPAGAAFPDGQPRPPVVSPAAVDERLLGDAVTDATRADVAVVVVGDRIELVGEGRSTATLELIGAQNALLDAVAATGTPMVVVLMASKPLVLPPSARNAEAIVWAANPGMQGGRAVAELLLGLIEPQGRLPISFAAHAGQQPTYYNQIRGQHGDRYADLTQDPPFVFGEGLSYTWVEYEDLVLDAEELARDGMLGAEITLRNVGTRPVRETVQVYVSDLITSASWTDQELKAFRQIDLEPGEARRIRIEIPVADLTIVDATGRRVVEPGEFELRIARSSRDVWAQRARFAVQ
ncbi:glycoside hydrolase family 3 C-terminal domain-containing protein, partial [Microbacterium sp. USTB-Y]|uniref:glycoside hydrolase family 3 C-terminal domain-containing protein n=1 Tax=Microbacterium sp. USTB-Y TaxID=2823692 RepID=UPI002041B68E